MDAEDLRTVVIAALGAGAVLWLVLSFVFRVTGTWERVMSPEELADGARSERVTLGQLGPFVTGRRDVAGGYQEFSGLLVGRRLTLHRRDHGVRALLAMGFPEPVAARLDGEVMARLRLTVTHGGLELLGSFEPQKVEFTHQPPRVTRMYFLEGQPRHYRRVVDADERVSRMDEVQAAGSLGPP